MLSIRFYVVVILGVGVVAGLAFGGHGLYRAGYDAAEAKQASDAQLIADTAEQSQQAAADAISKMTVKHVTIRQTLEKEISHDTVYRECVASPRVLELTNEALTDGSDSPATR